MITHFNIAMHCKKFYCRKSLKIMKKEITNRNVDKKFYDVYNIKALKIKKKLVISYQELMQGINNKQ